MTLHKKSVAWHEEALQNQKKYLEQEEKIFEMQKQKIEELRKSTQRREKIIAFAKSKGMKSFDEDSKVFKNII